jgi:hypothetical protein
MNQSNESNKLLISDTKKPFLIGDQYEKQVRAYSALGYTSDRIVILLQLNKDEQESLLSRIETPGDLYHIAFSSGIAIGEYNIDIKLVKLAESGETEATKLLEERRVAREQRALRQKLFGI